MTDFENALKAFCAMADALVKEHCDRSWAMSGKTKPENFPVPEIASQTLTKYVRIIKQERNPASGNVLEHGGVFCFIDISNGDILKAAGFKAPAKGKRGSIYAEDHGRSAITPYGAVYRRG